MNRPRIVLAVTVLTSVGMASFGLASCTGRPSDGDRAEGDRVSATTTDSEGALHRYSARAEIPHLYDFSATTLDGEAVSGVDYQDKALALWFWAPW